MKKIYVSPVIVAEEILDDEILASSPTEPQMLRGKYATEQAGDGGDALSKGFNGFLDEDFGWE